jgi:integrase
MTKRILKNEDKPKLKALSVVDSSPSSIYGRTAADRVAGLTALHRGILPTPHMMFGTWLEHFVTSETNSQTQSTKKNARAYLKRILPELGEVRLGALNPLMLRSFMDSIKDLSSSTQQKIYGLLKRTLQDAVNLEVLQRNPMTAVKRPKLTSVNETEPLEPEQVEKLVKLLEGHRLELLFHLCLACGLRIGEACALRWSDVRGSVLQINYTINRFYSKKNNEDLFRPAKSGSAREMRIDTHTLALFAQHKIRQAQEHQGPGINPLGLVFLSTSGTPLDANNFYNRVFRDILEQSGLRAQGTHAMRKTYATLAAVVLPIQDVQARMGHKDPRMTLRVYAKSQARRNTKAAVPLSELIKASKIDEVDGG